MDPRARRSALWGAVSGLLFAVLALGYRITTGVAIPVLVVLVVAVAVGSVTGVLSHLAERRFG